MSLVDTREREKLYAFAGEFLKFRKAASALDIACGDGTGAETMARIAAAKITGLDFDEKLIGAAKSAHVLPNIEFARGDARRTGLPTASFDIIVSFHTLEHFSGHDQEVFLEELRRLSESGGFLLLATPDRDVWKLQGIAGTQEDHIKELNREETEKLLAAHGWKVSATYGQFVLKRGNFFLRRLLNFLKRLDALKLRRLFGRDTVNKFDMKTQPVDLSADVLPLTADARASVNVFVCEKF